MNRKVMIVEDESIVALELLTYLEDNGYIVVGIASNAKEAYTMAREHAPEVILMDINIYGDEDGISVAKNIKKCHNCSIIYITAFSDDKSFEEALETDPASYLIKPFDYRELSMAIKIALKRLVLQKDDVPKNIINIDHDFSYDPYAKQLFYREEQVHLTRQEQQLLTLLIEAKGQLVAISSVEISIWGDKFPSESTRRGVVARLRSKLKHQFLETVSGQGYRFSY